MFSNRPGDEPAAVVLLDESVQHWWRPCRRAHLRRQGLRRAGRRAGRYQRPRVVHPRFQGRRDRGWHIIRRQAMLPQSPRDRREELPRVVQPGGGTVGVMLYDAKQCYLKTLEIDGKNSHAWSHAKHPPMLRTRMVPSASALQRAQPRLVKAMRKKMTSTRVGRKKAKVGRWRSFSSIKKYDFFFQIFSKPVLQAF